MRFTTDRYEQMVDTGILTEDDRVELIDGEILEMAPSSPAHSYVVRSLTDLLTNAVRGRALVQIQSSVRLPPESEPEPDVAVLLPPNERYRDRHPGSGDVLLIIEAGRTSLRRDRRQKIPLYARNEIAEAWLVDISAERLEVYRQPSAGHYASIDFVERGGVASPLAFPDVQIAVDDFLP